MASEVVQQIANALSTLTIMSCLFLKVPQILHIRSTRSAEGIYIQAMLMEITGFTITTLYNYTNKYSLMTYLEYPIILAQVYVLTYYVLRFNNMLSMPIVPLGCLAYATTVTGFVTGALSKDLLSLVLPFCTPLSGFAKVTYIYGIIKVGNADGVSLTTWWISITTNLVRIFTVYVDSADAKLMGNFAISTLLSTGVLLTAVYYRHNPTKERRQEKTRRKSCHHD